MLYEDVLLMIIWMIVLLLYEIWNLELVNLGVYIVMMSMKSFNVLMCMVNVLILLGNVNEIYLLKYVVLFWFKEL